MTLFELHVPSTAKHGVITIGNFDGVHRGHQAMLAIVRKLADRRKRPAVIVTFDPHPVTVLRPEIKLPRLSEIDTRVQLLKNYGADEVVVMPVDRSLLDMSAEQFFNDVVCQQLQPVAMVEGPDFRFGKDRFGDTQMLSQLCEARDIELQVIPPVCESDRMISSTRIRDRIAGGNISDATDLLGHSYSISGVVRKGAGRGRQLGFPTANLEDINVLLPGDGVYAGRCDLAGKSHAVALSIGPNPTFDDNARKVECHIVGFEGDLYELTLEVELVNQIRKLKTFESVAELTEQIRQDVADCVRAVGG